MIFRSRSGEFRMRYVVHVAAVFDGREQKGFDLWENVVLVEADDPRNAFENALLVTRDVLENAGNCRQLGYDHAPMLYAITSVHTYLRLASSHAEHGVLEKIAELSEDQFRTINSFQEVSLPYKVMHIQN